jgi:hypothetical protein
MVRTASRSTWYVRVGLVIATAAVVAAGGLFALNRDPRAAGTQSEGLMAGRSSEPTIAAPATAPSTTGPTTPPATKARANRTGCVADPGACGFPTASTTGPPAGVTLANYTGPSRITKAGTRIENVRTGCLEIAAPDVTIHNAVIQCDNSSYAVSTIGAADTTGMTTVDHVRLVCTGHGGTAFGDNRMAISFVDISRCENGGDADATFSITDSYIHDMFHGDAVAPDPHTDGIQVWPGAPGIVFSRNTVLVRGDNAAFTAGRPEGGVVAHLTVEDNLFDGGSYTVYCADNAGSLSGNRFGPIGPNHTAPWGHVDRCATMTRTGNIEDATNQPIPASALT